MSEQPFEQHAIVELFGHQKIAGRVSEQVIAGHGFIRVDVPASPATQYCPEQAGFTRLYGPTAVYSITPVSEQIATLVAASLREKPVNVYVALPAGDQDEEDDDDGGAPF